jgi:uncharacterized protein YkwD
LKLLNDYRTKHAAEILEYDPAVAKAAQTDLADTAAKAENAADAADCGKSFMNKESFSADV